MKKAIEIHTIATEAGWPGVELKSGTVHEQNAEAQDRVRRNKETRGMAQDVWVRLGSFGLVWARFG